MEKSVACHLDRSASLGKMILSANDAGFEVVFDLVYLMNADLVNE